MILLDTNVVVAHLKGNATVSARRPFAPAEQSKCSRRSSACDAVLAWRASTASAMDSRLKIAGMTNRRVPLTNYSCCATNLESSRSADVASTILSTPFPSELTADC
jgi:hypothetical protein